MYSVFVLSASSQCGLCTLKRDSKLIDMFLGTNNARLAGMLRQLAMYYHKDANNLYMTRIAQVILINPPLLVDIFT
jgi:hypothetical protein